MSSQALERGEPSQASMCSPLPACCAVSLQASIKPKCGRMISFSSGGENPHGVKAVTKGQRCAVALWFTLDPLYRELERIQADEVIAMLDQEHLGPSEMNINPKDEL